jgi:hypothetical protein
MSIGRSGKRHERAGQEIAGGGNVIAGFIPEIWETEQRGVQCDQSGCEERK